MAAVAHYYWLVKSDIRLPMLYGTLVAFCWPGAWSPGPSATAPAEGLESVHAGRSHPFAAAALLWAADLKIDHVTIAGSSLNPMQANLSTAGIPPVYGGTHPNGATEMAVVSFPMAPTWS